ncbi:MAG: alpha/beta hydrolase [Fimbriimonas sp.]|nr:alpha/beta hydrolase [Fimbriimonas sp.]
MRGIIVASLALTAVFASAQTRVRDVIYMKSGGCAYTMDVFKPKTSNHKAIVWMVSGGWVSNHEGINPMLAAPFNEKGFTVFQVVHGSQPKYTIPEIIPMVRRAVRFVRDNAATYDVLPNAIGVCGGSAGGHLSLEIAGLGDDGDPNAKDPVDRVSSKADAVVAFFPPTDFENWGSTGVTPFTVPGMQVFFPAFGVTKDTPKDTLQKVGHDLSPIRLVKAGFPPTLLVHGDADMLVPVQQSKLMDAAFEAAHVTHRLLVIHGTGHDGNTMMKGLAATLDWFDKYLPASKN